MKRSSLFAGIAIGSAAVLVVLFLAKLIGLQLHDAFSHQQAWGRGYGHHGFRAPMHDQAFGLLALVSVIARIAVLIVGAAMFFKAKGFLRWAGALFALLSLMSLLTPFWGLAIAAVVIWLGSRVKKNDKYVPSSYAGTSAYPPVSYDRGRFLDEWERNNKKED